MTLKRRKLTLLSIILAALFILPMAIRVPVLGAEGLTAWDMATYEDLEDLSEDIVAKYVEAYPSDGIAMDMSFHIDFTYDDSPERNRPENYAIQGDIHFLGNADKSAMVNLSVDANFDQDVGKYLADIYVQNDEENPGGLIFTVYASSGSASEADTTYDVMQEVLSPEDIEQVQFSELTVQEFNSFAAMKVLEDQGDTVDVVTLISIPDFIDALQRAIKETASEQEADLIDLEGTRNQINDIGTQIGISEWAYPIHMTIEKETGHMLSARLENAGLQELVDKLLVWMSDTDGIETMDSPITINAHSLVIENVQYKVNEPIVLPTEVLEMLEALEQVE